LPGDIICLRNISVNTLHKDDDDNDDDDDDDDDDKVFLVRVTNE
jgi:hypothetical protein